MRNYFTFGEYDSRDFGVFITRDGVYNAPRKVYNTYQVPGRNGDLHINQNRMDNIEVVYPACIYAGFDANLTGLRNALMSQNGYVRITDSYHPDEYRLGVYKGDMSVIPTVLGDGGTFEIVFDCKPQRFLLSGETERTIDGNPETTETVSGGVVSFAGTEDTKITDVQARIEPQQSLNGYDKPWSGGGGKNLIPYPYYEQTHTEAGITWTDNGDGTITANGTATATSYFTSWRWSQGKFPNIVAGQRYVLSLEVANGTASIFFSHNVGSTNKGEFAVRNLSDGYAEVEFTAWEDEYDGNNLSIYINAAYGQQVNTIIKPMLRLASVSDATWEPYANICPITGHTSVEVTRAGKNYMPANYYSGSTTIAGITYTVNSDGSVKATGKATATSVYYIKASTQTHVIPAGDYVLSGCPAGGGANTYKLDIISGGATLAVDYGEGANFTRVSQELTQIRIAIYSGQSVDLTFKPSITKASDYDKRAIAFPSSLGTVYSGTLDVTTGKLTVDKKYVEYDGGEAWGAIESGYRVGLGTDRGVSYVQSDKANWLLPATTNPTGTSGVPGTFTTGSFFNINVQNIAEITDVASLKTYLAKYPLQAVYQLATPIEYTLTRQEVAALVGTNTIWANAGDVTVEYGEVENTITNPTLFASKPIIKITPAPIADNLIPYPYSDSGTVEMNGVTFTENSGTITANGTASGGNGAFNLFNSASNFTLPEGTYKLSGYNGEAGGGIYLWVYYEGSWKQIASLLTSGSVNVVITEAYAGQKLWMQCLVSSGKTVTNARYQPVIAAIASSGKLIKIGSQKVYVANVYPYVIIDSELQDCYRGINNLNSQVTFEPNEFPVLEPGANDIEFSSDIQSVEITPRWYIV